MTGRRPHNEWDMSMNGDLPLLDDDLRDLSLPHVAAARMMLNQGKGLRRTDSRGIVTMPLRLAIDGLHGRGCDDILQWMEHVHRARTNRGGQTSIQIGPGRMHADRDLGIERLAGAGATMVQDGSDDPVLARLLALNGVERLARIEAGLDGRWRMHERSAHPYVNYAGLPDELPPFILRPHSAARASMVEIEIGQGVTYSNLGAFRMIALATPLPETVAVAIAGRPVTDVIAHPALEGLMFATHDGPAVAGAHVVVEMDVN